MSRSCRVRITRCASSGSLFSSHRSANLQPGTALRTVSITCIRLSRVYPPRRLTSISRTSAFADAHSEGASPGLPGSTCSTRKSPVFRNAPATASARRVFCILTTTFFTEHPPFYRFIKGMEETAHQPFGYFSPKIPKQKRAALAAALQYPYAFRSNMTSPLSRARTASSVRFRNPVFSSIFRMCVFTEATDMCRRSAIS